VNEDEMGLDEELAGDELERMLERYARVRLDPGQASMRRARSAVMGEAWSRHLAGGAASGGARRSGARRRPFEGWGMRRLGSTLAAAVMAGLIVGSSVFAASRAGGPLYGIRLAADDLLLPADADARLEAELAQAQTHLAEAVDASVRGDQGALLASLEAYGQTLSALGAERGTGAERALEAVRLHRAVLVAVLDGAPAAAIAGLEQAIARSDALIAKLDEAATPGAGPDGSGAGSQGGGQPARPGAAPTPKAEVTPKPTREPKADVTPKPTREPKADVTPKPERTAKPQPTPKTPQASQPTPAADPGDQDDQ
jgi:hypothetical protein